MGNNSDPVNHPDHYAGNRLGDMECIDVARYFGFSDGNVIKYCWRAGFKIDALEDLDKAEVYLKFAKETGIDEDSNYYNKRLVVKTLKTVPDLTVRQKIIVDIVAALTHSEYNDVGDSIRELRDYIKEKSDAEENSGEGQ